MRDKIGKTKREFIVKCQSVFEKKVSEKENNNLYLKTKYIIYQTTLYFILPI